MSVDMQLILIQILFYTMALPLVLIVLLVFWSWFDGMTRDIQPWRRRKNPPE